MVAGLGTAAELVADHVVLYGDHMRQVRDYLEEQLQVGTVDCFEWTVMLCGFVTCIEVEGIWGFGDIQWPKQDGGEDTEYMQCFFHRETFYW